MPASILIVDDNSDLADVLSEIFIASGYRVRVAGDGECTTVLIAANERRPALR